MEIKEYIKLTACTKCPELVACRRQVVPLHYLHVASDSSSKPIIMYVARNPGKVEDRDGEPLKGPAGKIAREQVKEYVDNDLATVILNNIVKCYSPDNRRPTDAEKINCTPYLEEEIRFIKPDIVILTGDDVFEWKKMQRHQVMCERDEDTGRLRVWVATYHPANLLRDASHRDVAMQDIRGAYAVWMRGR